MFDSVHLFAREDQLGETRGPSTVTLLGDKRGDVLDVDDHGILVELRQDVTTLLRPSFHLLQVQLSDQPQGAVPPCP